MNSNLEIEQVLANLGNEWPAGDSLVDQMLRRIDSEAVRVDRSNTGARAIKSILAIAASLVFVAGLWWILSGGNTLYAQVVNAIQRANSLHMTMTVGADKKHPAQPAMETWYERGVGFRETIGGTVRLGNQQNFWTYLPESKTAIRSASHGIDDVVSRILDDEFIKALASVKPERDPKGDETIDGKVCQAYVVTNIPHATDPDFKSGKKRLRFLLDNESRLVRAFMEERADDKWGVQLTMNWKYDVPVDRALFDPHFGDDVKIVDADAVFDQFVDLNNAIYRKEQSGIIYAIHHAERFHDGGVLVVSSVRGTADTLKKYPPTHRPVGPGRIFVDGPAKNWDPSPQGDGYFEIELASADHQGINVRWWVVVPRGTPPTHFEVAPDKTKLRVGVMPQGEFAKAHLDERGVTQISYWDVVLDLPRSDGLPTLDSIAKHVYADLTALEAIPFKELDMGVKDNSRQLVEPSTTTAAEFSKAVAAHIRRWHEMDVEYQLERQFAHENAQNRQPPKDWPAIGLSYEPTVDDNTLVRVALHRDLKRLYLEGTAITDDGLKHLGTLKELHKLNLAHTSITDAGLQELEGLTALGKLDVRGTKVTADGIARLKAKIANLQVEK